MPKKTHIPNPFKRLTSTPEFEILWANFDPNNQFNQTTKDFIRALWQVVKQSNFGDRLSVKRNGK